MNNPISVDTIIKTIERGDLMMDEELHIYEVLLKKYPLLSIAEYARSVQKTPNGVRYLIAKDAVQHCEVNGKTMIIV